MTALHDGGPFGGARGKGNGGSGSMPSTGGMTNSGGSAGIGGTHEVARAL